MPNDSTAPTVFEYGDNSPPELSLIRVKRNTRNVRVTASVSERGTLTMRFKRGKRVVVTSAVAVNAGETTATLPLPVRVRNRPGRYTL